MRALCAPVQGWVEKDLKHCRTCPAKLSLIFQHFWANYVNSWENLGDASGAKHERDSLHPTEPAVEHEIALRIEGNAVLCIPQEQILSALKESPKVRQFALSGFVVGHATEETAVMIPKT